MQKILRKVAVLGFLAGAGLGLSACDPNATVTVGAGVYYDSVLWNDYYYGRPPPPASRPPRPPRPTPPIARPPRPTPPIHRPPRPMPR